MIIKNGNMNIKGSGRNIKIQYNASGRPFFAFNGRRTYLDTVLRVYDSGLKELGFSGMTNDTAFSGLLVKIVDSDNVNVYYYWM